MTRRAIDVSDETWAILKKKCAIEDKLIMIEAGAIISREMLRYDSEKKHPAHTPRTTQMRFFLQDEIAPGASISEAAAYNLIDSVFGGVSRRKFLEVVAEIRLSSQWRIGRVGKDRVFFRRT